MVHSSFTTPALSMPVEMNFRPSTVFEKLPMLRTKKNSFTHSSPEVATNGDPEAAVHASHEPSMETAGMDFNDDMTISAWVAAWNDESQPRSGKVKATTDDEANMYHEIRHTENRHEKIEDEITQEVKSAVKELDAKIMPRTAREALNDDAYKTFNKVQSGMQSVEYIVVERRMLDLLRKDFFGET